MSQDEPGAGRQSGEPPLSSEGEESGQLRRKWTEGLPREIGVWLHIAADGAVVVFTGKVETGQNIRTSLAQVVAEELHVAVAQIALVMGDTSRTPFDVGTFGSLTTPTMAAHLRQIAAAAREVLLGRAAKRWRVDREGLIAANGSIVDPATGRSLGYGQLTAGERLTEQAPPDVPLTPPGQWTVAGKPLRKLEGRAIVTGEHRYAADVKLPGMCYGRVLRPNRFNATLLALDTSGAETMSGVTVVREGDFVGVVAADRNAAEKALAAIKARWRGRAQPSEPALYQYLKTHPSEPEGYYRYLGPPVFERGELSKGLAKAEQILERSYTVAYVAHAPLEARAAVAAWEGDRVTVWTGTQRPFGVQSELAEALDLPIESVRVIVPDTGGGYGGKHTGEVAIEAARLARAAGKPVSVVWTREEEFTWAYFRPAGLIEVTSGIRADGVITAWQFHNYNAGPEGMRPPYEVPHQHCEYHFCQSPLLQGSYRALGATANHFARETHVDELAHAARIDPLAFRLKNLSDARLRAVLEAAADRFGWGEEAAAAESGFGLACGTEKGSYVATCAAVQVERPTGVVRVRRVVQAFECGKIVNPDGLLNQVEGAIVQGLGGALFEKIEFQNGRIVNPRFSAYRVPRFADLPAIEVVLLDRPDLPSAGAGETPIVGIAPAISNAIFAATGVRLRAMPLAPDGLPIEHNAVG